MQDTDFDVLVRDVRHIVIQLEALANQSVARSGLTGVQAYLLLYILHRSGKGTSLTEIQRELRYSKSTLSATVKRLRDMGYVRIVSYAGDDRRKILFATGKGEEIREFLEQSVSEVHHRLYGGFSGTELDTLSGMQKRMLRNLSPENQD